MGQKEQYLAAEIARIDAMVNNPNREQLRETWEKYVDHFFSLPEDIRPLPAQRLENQG